jgi:hypothetical protein
MLAPYEVATINAEQEKYEQDRFAGLTTTQLTLCLAWSRLTSTTLERVCEVMAQAQRDMVVSNR